MEIVGKEIRNTAVYYNILQTRCYIVNFIFIRAFKAWTQLTYDLYPYKNFI
jgi:hypothetical protein